MKTHVTSSLIFLAIIGTAALPSCNKSSGSTGGSGGMISKGDLAGNWATRVFVNSTGGQADTTIFTALADTLQFTSDGKLNAAYYVQGFDTVTSHVILIRKVDSATFTFLNDTTIHIAGQTNLYITNNSSDVFIIHFLNAQQLQLFSADPGGSGGYLYIYSRF
jgi:hypothetical protein